MSRFLTEQEYVDENRRQFRRLHQRDGVWCRASRNRAV